MLIIKALDIDITFNTGKIQTTEISLNEKLFMDYIIFTDPLPVNFVVENIINKNSKLLSKTIINYNDNRTLLLFTPKTEVKLKTFKYNEEVISFNNISCDIDKLSGEVMLHKSNIMDFFDGIFSTVNDEVISPIFAITTTPNSFTIYMKTSDPKQIMIIDVNKNKKTTIIFLKPSTILEKKDIFTKDNCIFSIKPEPIYNTHLNLSPFSFINVYIDCSKNKLNLYVVLFENLLVERILLEKNI